VLKELKLSEIQHFLGKFYRIYLIVAGFSETFEIVSESVRYLVVFKLKESYCL